MRTFMKTKRFTKLKHFCIGLLLTCTLMVQAQDKPNIVFIAVDDLNCDLGVYGNTQIKSPNMDALGNDGMTFLNHHCQQPVCGPSRSSLLSGMTPDHTGIKSFGTYNPDSYLRDNYPDILTIPLYLKMNGYRTEGMGKIHDHRNVSTTDNKDMISWTKWNNAWAPKYANSYTAPNDKPIVESADVADNKYTDGILGDKAAERLDYLAGQSEPFFLAVGFHKPHLPFIAPKSHWDKYDRNAIDVAAHQQMAANDLGFESNPASEFFGGYTGVASFPFSLDAQREYIHGYYACVSYIDAQVGKITEKLKNLGVYDNTIIILWSDHGFSLGDHNSWGKHTLFKSSTRCPLIIKAPGVTTAGTLASAPTEHIDLFPTICDLAGLTEPFALINQAFNPDYELIIDNLSPQLSSYLAEMAIKKERLETGVNQIPPDSPLHVVSLSKINNELQVYPNPIGDFVYVSLPNQPAQYQYEIYNLSGELVLQGGLDSNKINCYSLSQVLEC